MSIRDKIIDSIESKRKCGYRKQGGFYFVSTGKARACYKLPIALETCPCCGLTIKFSRGFQWINSNIFSLAPCENKLTKEPGNCEGCPMNIHNQQMGLMWVGDIFYSPQEFVKESAAMGISKRISKIPKDFVVGKTWIAIAHIKAIAEKLESGETDYKPGIFTAFKPDRIDYILKGTETDAELEELVKKGITLVNVIKDTDTQQNLF